MRRTEYNKTDVTYILEAYKKGISLDDICKKLKEYGSKTPQGKDYSTAAVSYIANQHGLRRMTRRNSKIKRQAPVKPKANHFITELEEILSSNLSCESKMKFFKILSQDL